MIDETTVADRILLAAADAGATTVFGLPGVHNLAFWRSDVAERIVVVRHEQTAVYAADGFARASGGIGLALTTTGPGAANAVAAFGEAAASRSPVVLVASEVPGRGTQPDEGRGSLHESRDQAGLFVPLAKQVFRPRTAEDAAAAFGRAVECALHWPRGPVYVDVPADVLWAGAPPIPRGGVDRLVPADEDLAAAARTLASARSVVVWAGGGVVQSGAEEVLATTAERLDAPVVMTFGARGALPSSHPLAVRLPPHEPEVAELVASADVLLAVGTDFDGMTTRNGRMPVPPTIVSVNCRQRHLARWWTPSAAVLGDARLGLEGLLLRTRPSRRIDAAAAVAEVNARAWQRLRADSSDVDALALIDTIDRLLPDEAMLVCDMTILGYWAGGYARRERSRTLQYPVGWGTLGYALPAAVGAASTGRTTLAICGDGGAVMGLGELATIAQERLPAAIVVVVDGGYGMLRYDQDRAGHPRRGTDLDAPDFVAIARAFGLEARRVDGPGAGFDDALSHALSSGTPQLIEVPAVLRPPRTTSPRWFDPVLAGR